MKTLTEFYPLLRSRRRAWMLLLCLFAARFALFPTTGCLAATGPRYPWPLKADPAVTSSFGEYRPGHFHMGADLKTWGQVGYKIIAVGDGYVSRVRVSPYGYGKALYLTLDDGCQAVYAHLDDFEPFLREVLQIEQDRLGRYSIDLWFPPHRFPVKSGDVLGATGRTATSAPHLHFEFRDRDNRPVNPFANGFAIDDHIRPVITEILVVPLGADSRVQGGLDAVSRRARRVGTGKFRIDDPVNAQGEIGLAVRSYDMADARTNLFEPYSYELYLNNNLIFRSRYDLISYDIGNSIDLAIDFRHYMERDKRFFNLYRLPFNNLRFDTDRPSDSGIIAYRPGSTGGLAKGAYVFTVRVADVYGNFTLLEMPVTLDLPPVISAIERGNNEGELAVSAEDPDGRVERVVLYLGRENGRARNSWELKKDDDSSWRGGPPAGAGEGVYFVRAFDELGVASAPRPVPVSGLSTAVRLEPGDLRWDVVLRDSLILIAAASPVPLYRNPEAVVVTAGGRFTVELERRGLGEFQGAFYPGEVSGAIEVQLRIESPDGRQVTVGRKLDATLIASKGEVTLASPDNLLSLRFNGETAYYPFLGRIHPPQELPAMEGLEAVTGGYLVEPGDVPMNKGALLSFKLPAEEKNDRRVGIYWRKAEDEWEYVDTGRLDRSGSILVAPVSAFSEFAVLKDLSPPEILNVYPDDDSRVRELSPRFRFNVLDIGSGIDEDGIELRLNGVKVVSEFDAPRDAVYYQPPRPLAPGRHRIRIDVRDRAGNHSVWKGRFTAAPR